MNIGEASAVNVLLRDLGVVSEHDGDLIASNAAELVPAAALLARAASKTLMAGLTERDVARWADEGGGENAPLSVAFVVVRDGNPPDLSKLRYVPVVVDEDDGKPVQLLNVFTAVKDAVGRALRRGKVASDVGA